MSEIKYEIVKKIGVLSTSGSGWTPTELFAFKVPPPCWKLPALHGSPSRALLQLAQQWAV